MASKPVAFLLADLGVTKTHNRPHCSNDNPYSNAHFRTLKYLPSFPARFGPYRRFAGDRATVTVGWCAREPRSEVGTEIAGPIRRLPWQSCFLTGSQRSHESTAM